MNATAATTASGLPSGAVRTSDGDVIVPATRRADGSLRKPIRIRKGYVPQEEVPKYRTIAQRVRVPSSCETGPGLLVALDAKPDTPYCFVYNVLFMLLFCV